MNEVLALSGIEKGYKRGTPGEVVVLRGVSLSIARGEVVALVAPSGAGKSTLLHIAGLLDAPDAGTVRLIGQDMADLADARRTEARRRTLGFVYQFHHLLPEFTAAENIILPQLANGVAKAAARARAEALLARVGLADRTAHRPAELSGGEQQRVAFCRALANGPALLLADEPTGNLDPATSDQVFAVLMDLVRETGLSALIATHNMALAARMDRVVRLERGRVV
ncbi:ABC transporter ATP-binding protein [Phaeovulum sp.]|uniref:ABC transporter ATP-binding protein n=1 Tax=Phaeovulum sp. TaxID=2934796 RepID=UPI002731276D|nr:ABC transporter ATP-binding protein [Phaeovulum sp.]MDP1668501.1 ABC transporter ATP-binding protein [Phaeovulum sp.]MDP2062938.1 ABC transporter ATP-binding protein [Phaeovulum sp.]MDZ4118784.1 ABC transporter ATP-binding protein [Phaeovulum sp.]